MYIDPNLPREVFGWHSDRLGLDMPIVRYGNWGRPLLLFPTAGSDLYDCERFWLIKAIEHHIFAGRVSVFSIDTINKMSWMDEGLDPREAGRRQALYSGYIEEEVAPHIRRAMENPTARIAVTGASFGAFHAANALFRRPDLFDTLIGMSGFYDLRPGYTRGVMTDDIYFNNPMQYVKNISDAHQLHLLRHSSIHLVCGQGEWERPEKSRAFSTMLWDKGIWNDLDLWGQDVNHDWPWWKKMLSNYIDKLGW
ncbi:MAG: esterase family protein [Polyangiaceae bacterium]